jgi:hypothetical protein
MGGFCGSFPPPKEAFVSQPFFGDYASNGGNRLGLGDDTEEPETSEPEEEEEEQPEEPEAPSGGTEFDPEQYESAPQDPPDTDTP